MIITKTFASNTPTVQYSRVIITIVILIITKSFALNIHTVQYCRVSVPRHWLHSLCTLSLPSSSITESWNHKIMKSWNHRILKSWNHGVMMMLIVIAFALQLGCFPWLKCHQQGRSGKVQSQHIIAKIFSENYLKKYGNSLSRALLPSVKLSLSNRDCIGHISHGANILVWHIVCSNHTISYGHLTSCGVLVYFCPPWCSCHAIGIHWQAHQWRSQCVLWLRWPCSVIYVCAMCMCAFTCACVYIWACVQCIWCAFS